MRQVITTKTLKFFEELNAEQQLDAVNNLRDLNTSHDWWDCTKDDFNTILEMLGFFHIDAYFSGFHSQGDGACFSAKFIIPKDKSELDNRLQKVRYYAPTYLDGMDIITIEDFTYIDGCSYESITHNGAYHHAYSMNCDNDNLLKFARCLANRYYRDLSKEYEYLQSYEAIKETILNNEYEFNDVTLKIDC